MPAGAGAVAARRAARPRLDRPGRRRAGAAALGEQPREPDRSARRPRRGGATGGGPTSVPVFSDECYVEFTWDGPRPHDPRIGPRRRRGGPLVVEAVEPGRRARRVLRRRRRAGRLPPGGAQARRHDGAGPRTGGGGRGARRRRARRGAARALPGPPRAPRVGAVGLVGRHRAAARRRVLSVDSRSTTGGPTPSGWPATGERSSAPGEFYGPDGARFVRVAVVQPDDRIQLVADRLAAVRG